MEIVLIIIVVGALVALAAYLARKKVVLDQKPEPTRAPARMTGTASTHPTVTLDVAAADPDSPAVQRLTQEMGRRILDGQPEIEQVTIQNRDGAILGVVRRDDPRELPDVELPPELHEPHRRHERRPRVVERQRHPHPEPSGEVADLTPSSRPLADRLELPDAVMVRIQDPDDPVEVVRALLEAGGHSVDVDGDLLRTGNDAIIVLSPGTLGQPTSTALNHAFLRFQQSRAPRGVVIVNGYLPPSEARRRELLAPDLRYAGPESLQRMADAVALGADPLLFLVTPQIERTIR